MLRTPKKLDGYRVLVGLPAPAELHVGIECYHKHEVRSNIWPSIPYECCCIMGEILAVLSRMAILIIYDD